MSTQLPAVHSVHVYDDDLDLIARLCGIAATSLRLGDAVLIVATEEHREQLVKELEHKGIDVRTAIREGRYVAVDAAGTLSYFMREGWPDAKLFAASIGTLLADARARATSKGQGLTVFGEMVAVLWESGQKKAALALENIWNAALNDGTFHLHCAYARNVFADGSELHSVCEVHSHVLQ